MRKRPLRALLELIEVCVRPALDMSPQLLLEDVQILGYSLSLEMEFQLLL